MKLKRELQPAPELERQFDAYGVSAQANSAPGWKKQLMSWSVYAAAAGSALAFATAADADIFYSGPLKNAGISLITSGGRVKTSVTGPIPKLGSLALGLHFDSIVSTRGNRTRSGSAFLRAPNGGNFLIARTRNLVSRLGTSYRLGVSFAGGFRRSALLYRRVERSGVNSTGRPFRNTATLGFWPRGVTAFAGFRLFVGNVSGVPQYDFGWVRLRWDSAIHPNVQGFPTQLTAIDWALNTTPNQPIHVPDPLPEPNSLSLALLAVGAAGVLAWRRRLAGGK